MPHSRNCSRSIAWPQSWEQRKEKIMASQVILKTECLHVKKGGVELLIIQGNKTFGTLTVSNAKVSWFAKGAKKPVECDWKKFAKAMGGLEK